MEILVRSFIEPDRAEAQEQAIQSATKNTEHHLSFYRKDSRSYGGKYVAADLFKESFEVFSASKDARNKYNTVVHNSAAALSDLQFRWLMQGKATPPSDNVIFLTGIPGAGKTTSVISGKAWPVELAAIFEGQLSNPTSAYPKIDAALNSEYKVVIVAVHAVPEDALNNTITRFNEYGRGATINVMADIQGNLPDGLNKIYERYGDNIKLRVRDFRDRANPILLHGWNHLDLLRSEGNTDAIKERLAKAVNHLWHNGQISEAAYRQATGKPIIDDRQSGRMARPEHGRNEKDALQRGLPENGSQANIIKDKTGKSR
jgi:hypothetical protein